jgi:hypothetical protein
LFCFLVSIVVSSHHSTTHENQTCVMLLWCFIKEIEKVLLLIHSCSINDCLIPRQNITSYKQHKIHNITCQKSHETKSQNVTLIEKRYNKLKFVCYSWMVLMYSILCSFNNNNNDIPSHPRDVIWCR